MTKQSIHVHVFKPVKKKVLLGRYVLEGARLNYADTAGYDILKQLKCECGVMETVTLERHKL